MSLELCFPERPFYSPLHGFDGTLLHARFLVKAVATRHIWTASPKLLCKVQFHFLYLRASILEHTGYSSGKFKVRFASRGSPFLHIGSEHMRSPARPPWQLKVSNVSPHLFQQDCLISATYHFQWKTAFSILWLCSLA